MLLSRLDIPAHESVFIRQSLSQGIRLDGRNPNQCREVEISCNRGEQSSRCEVSMGNTKVLCTVFGEIVAPYLDRPNDGIIQFNAALSVGAENSDLEKAEIIRLLEKSIRESEAIDTESLCVLSGERVWLITCDVRVLDYDGNVIDASVLATMGALRAFRKPEVSVILAGLGGNGEQQQANQIVVHSTDDREPLPLALHHSPLAVSFAIFSDIGPTQSPFQNKDKDKDGEHNGNSGREFVQKQTLLVVDPTKSEEACMDGSVTFSTCLC